MSNNLNEAKIQKIMNEVNEGKYDNYKSYEWDTLFLRFQQFYENQGDDTKMRFMLAERLIHSMKYDYETKKFKSELGEELQPKGGEYSYYRKRSHEINSPILKARYADVAWIGLREHDLILMAINSYIKSFPLLLKKNMNQELITYLIRSVHLLPELENRDKKLKIDALKTIIDTMEIIVKKKEIIRIKKTLEIFRALLVEKLKDWEEIEWLKVCELLENAIQYLSINEAMRNSFEKLLEICRFRTK
ncbi:MAG: hypothetical protein ACFFG0_08350 [Candidatus Thorarchaeota archaeon]